MTGVIASHDGKTFRIEGRDGVLINAGGFSHNKAMREKYGPQPSSVEWTYSNPGDTGEIIQAAMALGAAVDLMDQAWWNTVSVPAPGLRAANVADISRPHAIMVDQGGQRYCNESASYMEVGQKQYARHKITPAVPSWMIIDLRNRRDYPLYTAMPGETPQEWINTGYMKKADTLDDLARQCGFDPAVIKATTERFNGFARHRQGRGFPARRPPIRPLPRRSGAQAEPQPSARSGKRRSTPYRSSPATWAPPAG